MDGLDSSAESRAGVDNFKSEREHMLKHHLRGRGIADERVLAVLGKIPREQFLPSRLRKEAYSDRALPIGQSQTISQPYIVAYMTEALGLRGSETVLEIGTGSGYQTAILSNLVQKVYTIERIARLSRRARQILSSLGCENVTYQVGDGTRGWTPPMEFDAIIITAAGKDVPNPVIEQLRVGGRLVAPVGARHDQRLVRIERTEKGKVTRGILLGVAFVPLIGEHGWPGRSIEE